MNIESSRQKLVDSLLQRYPILSPLQGVLHKAHNEIAVSVQHGGTLFLCGNGGSAADCEHIAGELLKGFLSRRPLLDEQKKKLCSSSADSADGEYLGENLQRGIRAVSLISHPSLTTAMANDVAADLVFAQQLNALGRTGDVLLAISTSGNARNVLLTARLASCMGIRTIALTGRGGGALAAWADVLLDVDETETFKVQELHLPIYHTLCAMLECSTLEDYPLNDVD